MLLTGIIPITLITPLMLFTRPLTSHRISSIITLLTPKITLCFLSNDQTAIEMKYSNSGALNNEEWNTKHQHNIINSFLWKPLFKSQVKGIEIKGEGAVKRRGGND